jgi:hypothetical protein
MNFNDIRSRLERTFLSLNDRFDENVLEKISTHFEEDESSRTMKTSMGDLNQEKINNKILIILHNLASLKDNLKKCLKKNGHDDQIVEKEINNSQHLQVLIDLVNQEKHGYPLTRNRRSFLDPLIANQSHFLGMNLNSKNKSALFMVGLDGQPELSEEGTLVIDADIVDNQGNVIFKLYELVNTCFEKWVNLANTYNCTNEPLDSLLESKISLPDVMFKDLAVEWEKIPEQYMANIQTLSTEELFYKKISDHYSLIPIDGPFMLIYGASSQTDQEMADNYNNTVLELMKNAISEKVDEFKNSNDFKEGEHILDCEGVQYLNTDEMKVRSSFNEPFQEVDKLVVKVKFKLEVFS